MTVADDIMTMLFAFPDDIEGPHPEKVCENVYQAFVKPLEDVVRAVTDEWERSDDTFSMLGAKLYVTDEMIAALAVYRFPHEHEWQDTGFANLDDCAVCGVTRVHPEKEDP